MVCREGDWSEGGDLEARRRGDRAYGGGHGIGTRQEWKGRRRLRGNNNTRV